MWIATIREQRQYSGSVATEFRSKRFKGYWDFMDWMRDSTEDVVLVVDAEAGTELNEDQIAEEFQDWRREHDATYRTEQAEWARVDDYLKEA